MLALMHSPNRIYLGFEIRIVILVFVSFNGTSSALVCQLFFHQSICHANRPTMILAPRCPLNTSLYRFRLEYRRQSIGKREKGKGWLERHASVNRREKVSSESWGKRWWSEKTRQKQGRWIMTFSRCLAPRCSPVLRDYTSTRASKGVKYFTR